MSQDIRELGNSLHHWHSHPGHPGHKYCYVSTLDPFRIHIAKKADFKVLGSFPSFLTAAATMERLYRLEQPMTA